MGLPIWRDPEEKNTTAKPTKNAVANDATAALRSTIRRRPSVHGRRAIRTDAGQNPQQPSNYDRLYFSVDQNGAAVSELPPVPELHNYVPSVARRGRRIDTGATQTSGNSTSQSIQRRMDRRRRDYEGGIWRGMTEQDFLDSYERTTSRPQSRGGPAPPLTNLPTPPLDTSDPLLHSLPSPHTILERHAQMPTPADILERHHNVPLPHPLSFEQRATSPSDGLGDRTRSLSPTRDMWEIIRPTILPDETLPSTHNSSFISAAESASSQLSSSDTTVVPNNHVQPEAQDHTDSETVSSVSSDPSWGSEESSLRSSDDDSGPEADSEENWERRDERRSIGRRLYDRARQTEQGRAQIAEIRRARLSDPRYEDETRRMIARDGLEPPTNADAATNTTAPDPEGIHQPLHEDRSGTQSATTATSQPSSGEPNGPNPHRFARVQENMRRWIERRHLERAPARHQRQHQRQRQRQQQRQHPSMSQRQYEHLENMIPGDEMEEDSAADAATDSIRSISSMLTQLNENLRHGAEAADMAEVEAVHEAMQHVVRAQQSRRRREEHGREMRMAQDPDDYVRLAL